jgi:hypothetical protein
VLLGHLAEERNVMLVAKSLEQVSHSLGSVHGLRVLRLPPFQPELDSGFYRHLTSFLLLGLRLAFLQPLDFLLQFLGFFVPCDGKRTRLKRGLIVLAEEHVLPVFFAIAFHIIAVAVMGAFPFGMAAPGFKR